MDAVMDRETLAAFVDGALSPEDSARIVLHLADHPEDAAHVDALMELNALLGEAYGEPLRQPAPEPIVATIMNRAQAAAPRRGEARPGWLPAARPRASRLRASRLAIATAAAAVFVLVAGVLNDPGRFGRPVQILGAPPSVDADLRAALETAPSGAAAAEGGHQFTLIGTFFDRTGRPCREYELINPEEHSLTQGIACRGDGGEWSTAVSVASRMDAGVTRDAFVPASGAQGDPEALSRALDVLGAGMAMTPGEEQELIDSWR